MPKLQKKTEAVEAIQWTGKNFKAVEKVFPGELRVKNDRLYAIVPLTELQNTAKEINQDDYLFADGTVVSAEDVKSDYKEVK